MNQMTQFPPPDMQLNPQQEEVAEHVFGRILTLAGPGSGKTRTLTERTGRLIRKGFDAGSILCLTFTNKARDEMRERIAAAAAGMSDGFSNSPPRSSRGNCCANVRRPAW